MNRRRSCILTYHSLDDTGSVISVPPAVFREQMAWLADEGVPVVPLECIRDTPGAVAITFDDGFRNFFEEAVPVLQKHRFSATVFVVAGFCGGSNDWPSQPRHNGIPKLPLMNWREVELAARAGIGIGCHTFTHPRLSQLPASGLDEELHRSQAEIEQRIGRTVDSLAYPYGDATPQVRDAAARYYRLAVSTKLDFVPPRSAALDLPRLDAYYLRGGRWFRELRNPYGAAYIALRRWLRSMRQTVESR
jgi:peptidoglycan/xylan/chitin deacetylase (PgdA/CDA1 family)